MAEKKSVRDRAMMRDAKIKMIRRRRRMALLILIAAAAVVVIIGSWIYNSPYFIVKKVVVEGSEKVSREEIVKLSGITESDTLMKLDIDEIKSNLAKVSWVKEVKIDRDFPSTVRIVVTQREAVAVIPFDPDYLFIDDELVALEIKETVDDQALPFIFDIDLSQIKLGEKIEKEELKNAMLCLKSLDKELKSSVTSLSAPTVNDLEITIQALDKTGQTNQIDVRYGKAEKTEIKNSVIKEIMDSGKPVCYIDVRVPSNPAVKYLEESF
ncbi:MAG: FtsQ-type POTRA domain-containing protein [Actinomycetota bacterium]|nr:FtsQ-type POTRA domain-containing protein [Actinomycetota bacterium]